MLHTRSKANCFPLFLKMTKTKHSGQKRLRLTHLTACLWISSQIVVMQMKWEGDACVWIHYPPASTPNTHPSSALPLCLFLLLPGWSRRGPVSRGTLRNPGHGVSLGKQRAGQQGLTEADYSESKLGKKSSHLIRCIASCDSQASWS